MKDRNIIQVTRRPTPPGEILLQEFMQPLELTQKELAKRVKVPRRRINEIILGKRELSPDTAHRLAVLFGTSAEFWINLQAHFDLWRAYQKKSNEYRAIKPILANEQK